MVNPLQLVALIKEIAIDNYYKRPVAEEKLNMVADEMEQRLKVWKEAFEELNSKGHDQAENIKEIESMMDTDHKKYLTNASLADIHRLVRWIDNKGILLFDEARCLSLVRCDSVA